VHSAHVGGNAFLWIDSEPNTGNAARSLSVTDARGKRSTVTFEWPGLASPFTASSIRRPAGPTRIDARIPHPTIGWYVRGERRGLSVKQARLTAEQRQGVLCCDGVRLFKPDPLSNVVVGLGRGWCIVIVGGGSGCSDRANFFSRGPLNFMIFAVNGVNASDRFILVAGAAADGVERITIFHPDRERQSVPIRNNVFAAVVPNRLPLRVVSYNAKKRVVGTQAFPPQSFLSHFAASPAARRHLRPVLRVTGPNGTTASLSVGRAVNRTRCWQIAYGTGHSELRCREQFRSGPKIWVDFVQPAGRDLFVVGGADVRVADHVELRFANGDVFRARPAAGLFVFAIPKAHLSEERRFAYVLAVDRQGHRVQRQGFGFRTRR
jgi:hypothetical protein